MNAPQANGAEARWPGAMLRLMGEMALLPMTVALGALEAMLKPIRRAQAMVEHGLGGAPAGAAIPYAAAAPVPPAPTAAPGRAADQRTETNWIEPAAAQSAALTFATKESAMPDTNLSDDMVKLVRFTIAFIKRDEEHILGEGKGPGDKDYPATPRYQLARGEKIVTDNMTDEAFSSWVISEYFASQNPELISAEDKKYLRVYHEVLDRWAKQDREYEKNQLEMLASLPGIEEALKAIANK